MKNSFTNKQTNLDLNGPYLSFDSEPQSVTGIGTTVGGTTGATVTMSGISTAGFSTDRPTVFNPPCVSVIDENNSNSVDNQWIGFTSAHPARQFNLMRVSPHSGLGTPSSNLPGVAEYFRMYDVNRDNGMTTSRSDWYELAGFDSIANSGALISLWIDTSGSMDMSSVQASYNLFIERCNSAGISVETTTGFGENYIGAFVNELTGYDLPANKGSVDYRWHEVGVGPLSDSATVTGTATTTLTLSNLITPTDNGRQFFLQVDYDPDIAVGIGSNKITGNAPNEPFNSGIAIVTVTPLVEITTQPVLTTTFPNVATDITVVASLSDTSFADDIQYQWQLDSSDVSNGTITKDGVDTVVAGATTPTLTLTSNNSGIGYVARCRVSSATASNSPIVSDSQIYTVNVPTNVINIEAIKNAGTQAVLSNVDLSTGQIVLNAATSSTAADFFLYSLYAPNKDVDVEMTLGGGQGLVGNARGGYGGFSRIRFTMHQNEEYVIAGLTEAVKTPFVYRKGALMACVGGGGDAATGNTQVSDGGAGGGVNIGGETPAGGASGGSSIVAGSLGGNGIFGSSFQSPTLYTNDGQQAADSGGAGITIKCTKGVYYAQQGIGACSDVTAGKFRLSDGTEVTNTASINRGYKAGYNIIQTAGAKTNSTGGNGGHGMGGGQGGGYNSPGGGGSGYHDGSVTVVDTRLGGSTGNAKVVIRIQT
tara:strand:- start:192 stop:2309 length:2118 start_codon:yes stop_codon:yes gene_type:complete